MLLYFILGIVFISLIIPLLEALSSIISAWSEYLVYIFAFKIFKIKQKMGDKDQQESQSFPMGFAVQAMGEQVEVIEEEQDQEE